MTFQGSGKISSTVGLEAKLDTQRRPGDPTLCLYNALPRPHFFTCQVFCCFDSSCALLEPCWSSPVDLSEPSCSLPGVPFGRLLEASQGVPETPLGPHDEIPLRKLTARALWRLAPSWDAPIEFAVAACLHVCYQCSCRRVCLQVHVCRCVCPLVRAVPDWCSWNL